MKAIAPTAPSSSAPALPGEVKDDTRLTVSSSSTKKRRSTKAGTNEHPKAGTRSIYDAHKDVRDREASRLAGLRAMTRSLSSRESCGTKLRTCGTRHATKLVDSTRFSIFTMLLTLYALIGDDIRLLLMPKRMDVYFDVLTVICIVVFTVEIVATCIAKDDYLGSFFFWLDVLPSGTLILDLTMVADALFCNNVDGGSALKSGRAGRAGARAGRTVRIIRLIRLVKVYKMYAIAQQKREESKRGSVTDPGEEGEAGEWEVAGDSDVSDDEETDEPNNLGEDAAEMSMHPNTSLGRASTRPSSFGIKHDDNDADPGVGSETLDAEKKGAEAPHKETRVGKKLSEMTTRRVIVLVLVMLFGLPQFLPDTHGFDELKTSANFAMETIHLKWKKWCPTNASNPNELPECLKLNYAVGEKAPQVSEKIAQARFWYEKYFLAFVHLHHASDFAWSLHWVGFKSKSLHDYLQQAGTADAKAQTGLRLGQLAQLSQPALLGNTSLAPDVWDQTFADRSWVQDIVFLSESVKARLTSPWKENCMTNFFGVPLTPDVVEDSVCTLDDQLRCSEIEFYVPASRSDREGDDFLLVFAFDKRASMKLEAGLNILQTIFICLAVGIGAMSFSGDANVLLLKPIERMMTKMECIKEKPMEAMRLGDIEFRRIEFEHLQRRDQYRKANLCHKCFFKIKQKQKVQDPMETVILERTIIRLGALLALCFGESGGEIIGHYVAMENASGYSSEEKPLDLMVGGRMVDAVIGSCEIQHFAPMAEILQEEVLLFVNLISAFVHEIVDEYGGAPNKNLGSEFLCAWPLRKAEMNQYRKMVDMAMMAVARMVEKISSCDKLADYHSHESLLRHFGKQYRVSLGFGLHCGWAVEGAVGSDYKIDVSYISPLTKATTLLQSSTHHYGVEFLLSHDIVSRCTPEMAKYCRVIDQVTIKKNADPMRLYTLDLDTSSVTVARKGGPIFKNRFKIRQMREMKKMEKWAPSYRITDEFQSDYDLVVMRRKYSQEFFKRFLTAYRNYECGEWLVARDMFLTCYYEPHYRPPPVDMLEDESQWPQDGPTRTLLRFMRQYDFYPPEDWAGYRPLFTIGSYGGVNHGRNSSKHDPVTSFQSDVCANPS